jgi:hypothetical protein
MLRSSTLEAVKAVAEHGAKSIGQVKFDKVIALDSGSGDGDGAVNRLMTAAPSALVKFLEQMKAATGIDLEKRFQEIAEMPDDESAATASETVSPPATPGKPKSASKEKD